MIVAEPVTTPDVVPTMIDSSTTVTAVPDAAVPDSAIQPTTDIESSFSLMSFFIFGIFAFALYRIFKMYVERQRVTYTEKDFAHGFV